LANSSDIKQLAIDTILLEANSIKNLANDIDEAFVEVVDLIFNGKDRVIVTGIGKSAIVAGKDCCHP
jgi:arabinose-5-phosphate isomerase